VRDLKNLSIAILSATELREHIFDTVRLFMGSPSHFSRESCTYHRDFPRLAQHMHGYDEVLDATASK
jgi:hypothetical protein